MTRDAIAINQVLSKNLRELIRDKPSISKVCADLGINRTQFSRYLSGDAHPRPDVLARICTYFECDARILLTPLSRIRQEDNLLWPFEDTKDPFAPLLQDFDHARMPDGLYQAILPNMVDPGGLVSVLVQLFTTQSGIKGVRWGIPRPYAEIIDMPLGWRARKLTGFVVQHYDGVSFVTANPYNRMLMMCFVTHGYRGMPAVHTGYAAISQARSAVQTQIQPIIYRRMPKNFGTILETRRAQDNLCMSDLPEAFRHYLETWTAN